MIDVNELLNSLNRQESEVCEFKTNNSRPELIGKSISALANAAAVMAVDQAIFSLVLLIKEKWSAQTLTLLKNIKIKS